MAEPIRIQVYCRLDVVVHDPDAVLELAVARLRRTDDWPDELGPIADAEAELRRDLPLSLAALVDPDRALDGVPGVEVRRGRYWAEVGPPSDRFRPGFHAPR